MITGNLYLVDIHLEHINSNEITISRVLMVAENEEEIPSRFSCSADVSDYKSVRVVSVSRIKNKMHLLSNKTEQKRGAVKSVKTAEGGRPVVQAGGLNEPIEYKPNIYAIGITTTIVAGDVKHAMRKLGSYLNCSNTAGGEKTESPMSSDSQIMVEEIGKNSGFALPRDVSKESNRAQFVRG